MFKKARYVLAVYRAGSFTQAAEALYISQPCLSAAIKQIEAQVGARLFDRSTSFLHPTPIGLEYIKTAQEIVTLEEEFAAKASDFNSLLSGRIRVGGSNYVCSYVLPRVIEEFSKLYPHVSVEMTEEHSAHLEQMLSQGKLDVTVDSFDHDPKGCVYTPLLTEKILLAVPQNSKSAQKTATHALLPSDLYLGSKSVNDLKPLSIEHFREEKFILLKPGNSMYEHAIRIFKENDVTPHIRLSLDQLSTSVLLCMQGNGCTFVTDTIFKYHKFDNGILLYNVTGSVTRSFGVAHKKEDRSSKVIKEFIRIAKNSIT